MATLTKRPLRGNKDDTWEYLLIEEGVLTAGMSSHADAAASAAGQAVSDPAVTEAPAAPAGALPPSSTAPVTAVSPPGRPPAEEDLDDVDD